MMNKHLILLILGCLPVLAQSQTVERIYTATDRSVYLSGEEVWCSLFLLDADRQQTSAFSAVAYLELVGAEGTVATAKVSLREGRGAGRFRIPASTPTGSYALLAYTALNANEAGTGWMAGNRPLSVFNVTSTKRAGDVSFLDEKAYNALKRPVTENAGGITVLPSNWNIKQGEHFFLTLTSPKDADLCISIFAEDEILPPAASNIATFMETVKKEKKPLFTGKRIPEYDGEIVYAAVEGLHPESMEELAGEAVATLSSAGSPSDVYVGKVGEGGKLVFFTNNIFGDRELVCEINSRMQSGGYVTIPDNYLHPEHVELSPLVLSKAQYMPLIRRKAAFGVSLQADTLVQFIPRRQDFLLDAIPPVHYHLDDYTRFHTIDEILVEFIPELRIHTFLGKPAIQMTVRDAQSRRRENRDNILVMLDGVVISDISLLRNMDAMLLEDIDVYTQDVALGGISYNGVVNFVSRKNYVRTLDFPASVRVLDFQGVSYPLAYLGGVDSGTEKDLRQLLFWHPALELTAGQGFKIDLQAPSYEGRFRLVAEGLTADGEPVHQEFLFKVQ